MTRIVRSLAAALALLSSFIAQPSFAAADKPLVIESGQVKQLPSSTTLQVNASGTGAASINIPHGTAPSSPTNGDCWTTTAGLFCRINGATVGPYGTGGGGSPTFRGALVSKAATQTGADYTTAIQIAWDNESYDTDSIHDTVTNNSRMTVPAGVSYVKLGCAVQMSGAASTAYSFISIIKNGSVTAYMGEPLLVVHTPDATNMRGIAWSAVVAVSAGDYFECRMSVVNDTAINVVNTQSWFAMEIVQ